MAEIEEIVPELSAGLAGHGSALLSAPPGSGKTTLIPLGLLSEPWLSGKKIIILEPRRLAARLAARRLAANLGEEVGKTVGLAIRFEKRLSAASRIIVATEGVLTRMLQADPELPECGLIIFDEFHERSLEADLALALCLDVKKSLRPDLALLVMSATLDCGEIASFLDDCPIISGGSPPFPVKKIYLPSSHLDDFSRFDFHALCRRVATAVRRATKEEEGDILVFLPGIGEIRQVEKLLKGSLPAGTQCRPLYGDLSRRDQDRAIIPDPKTRRVILATSVAETSITIEGISTVIDSGFARRPRFDPNRGMTRLETVRITRAEATQRAGRAGRLGPGTAYRLWPENRQASLLAAPAAEIRNADLAPLAMELLRWGASPEELAWLDPPPQSAMDRARQLLADLGFREGRSLSAKGRLAARIPAHPRLAAMIIAGEEKKCPGLACRIAAILGERDLLGERDNADLDLRLDRLYAMEKGGGRAGGTIIKTVRLLEKRTASRDKRGREMAAIITACGYPDRIAQKRPQTRTAYRLADGGAAELTPHDPLAASDFLVVADLGRGMGRVPRINLSLALDMGQLLKELPELFRHEETTFWDEETGRVCCLIRSRLGALIFQEKAAKADPGKVSELLCLGVRKAGMRVFNIPPAAAGLRDRVAAAARLDQQGDWPKLDDQGLLDSLDQWLPAWAGGANSLAELARLDMAKVFSAMLDHRQKKKLDRDFPETFTTPAGNRVRIDYSGDEPVLAVRIQEMFGCRKGPAILGGRQPLLLHLLNPAMRPVQVTRDLESFWQNVYPEVKKELHGRYPKHPWPDDPAKAEPWRPGQRRRDRK